MSAPKYQEDQYIISSDGGIDGTATVEIIEVYFGKIDTTIVTLKTRWLLETNKIYLIYSEGSGRIFGCGGRCDKWSKKVTDNPSSIFELQILKRFSMIFRNKTTGSFSFFDSTGVLLAKGKFKQGRPVKLWKHYSEDGKLKTAFDLKKNITYYYSTNGYLIRKSTVTENIAVFEDYLDTLNGKLSNKVVETKNDSGLIMQVFKYYVNGNLKSLSGEVHVNINGGSESKGMTGIYEEYFENGKLKLKGQYHKNNRVGIWRWFHENGEFNSQFDYKNGIL
jgi:antitoxin component YwqK of YwqJK toxin-antitoxin module